ncbi:transketolase family protein [bacterium]|nr:transketolase family protein [bacterium]
MKKATRQAYGEALEKLGHKNSNVVVLDADLSGSTKTAIFKKSFPERFFNMGIAEANMVDTAAGFSQVGKIPFASTFSMFGAGRAFEQVRQSMAYQKANVKLVTTHGGISVGEDGGSHQSIEDVAIMRTIPNMTVIVPADATETEKVINAIAEYVGPVYVRCSRMDTEILFDENYHFEIGKGNLLKDGDDVTIIANGLMVEEALKAQQMLSEKKISAAVINMACIKPIDKELIVKYAKKTGAIVTAEEHSYIGGLYGAVSEVVSKEYPVRMDYVAMEDQFGKSGKPEELMRYFNLTAEAIVKKAEALYSSKK